MYVTLQKNSSQRTSNLGWLFRFCFADSIFFPIRQSNFEPCEDCGGSGICIECKGEGFILKKRTDESADRARNTAKNMATRYTSG